MLPSKFTQHDQGTSKEPRASEYEYEAASLAFPGELRHRAVLGQI